MRILIVEDDEDLRDLITDMLKLGRGQQDEIVAAVTGEEGLACIETFQPDVVILDLMLPIVEGEGVVELLRHFRTPKNMRIIVITAKYNPDEDLLRHHGVQEVLQKPFNLKDLENAVYGKA